jgi:hypothetical protein
MKKKFLSIFYAFLATLLITTSAGAGGSVKLSSATFSLGSLIAKGILTGLGKSDTIRVVLSASGPADVTCTNGGSNAVPGQSSPKVSAFGQQDLSGSNGLLKNGKSEFDVETVDPETVAWKEAGCPNPTWTGYIDFIYWNAATITVRDTLTNAVLLEQRYVCTTTRYPSPAVSCTPVS